MPPTAFAGASAASRGAQWSLETMPMPGLGRRSRRAVGPMVLALALLAMTASTVLALAGRTFLTALPAPASRGAAGHLAGDRVRPQAVTARAAEVARVVAAAGGEGSRALLRRRGAWAAAGIALVSLVVGLPEAAEAGYVEDGYRSYRAMEKREKVVDIDTDAPPIPSDIPFIRKLQEKSWLAEPTIRTRTYLLKKIREKYLANPWEKIATKYVVHEASDVDSWDVLTEASFKEATNLGKILSDAEMTDLDAEFVAATYALPKDQEWVAKNLGVVNVITLDEALKKNLDLIKSRKFGESEVVSGNGLPGNKFNMQ